MWKKYIKQASDNTSLLVVKDHHLLRSSRIIISQECFDNLFANVELPWKEIYVTARKATANSHLRHFNYEIINNSLYLNKKLFQFGKTQSSLCSFCHIEPLNNTPYFS